MAELTYQYKNNGVYVELTLLIIPTPCVPAHLSYMNIQEDTIMGSIWSPSLSPNNLIIGVMKGT